MTKEMEILVKDIEKRAGDLEEVKCHVSVHVRLQIEFSINELNDIIAKLIPEAIKKAKS